MDNRLLTYLFDFVLFFAIVLMVMDTIPIVREELKRKRRIDEIDEFLSDLD